MEVSLPNSSWKEIENNIFKIGTNHVNSNASQENLEFLRDIDFIVMDSQNISLTQNGTDLFRAQFVVSDQSSAELIITNALLKHPIVSLIIQVFKGRGSTTRQQIWTLLCHHRLIKNNLPIDSLGNLLATLNKFKIIKYDKKNSLITVTHEPTDEVGLLQYFVSPTTPYTNLSNLRKIIKASHGNLCWIDKHFRKEGFEPLIDVVDGQITRNIVIISGNDNVTQSAITDYSNAKSELSHRNVNINWWVCNDQTFLRTWHDRWLFADNHCYNIPPVLSIIRGQQSEMLKTTHKPDINIFLANCSKI